MFFWGAGNTAATPADLPIVFTEVTPAEWIDLLVLESDTGLDVSKTRGIRGGLGLVCRVQEGTSAGGFVCGEANPRAFWLKNIPYPVSKKCKGPGARVNFTSSWSSRKLGPRGE